MVLTDLKEVGSFGSLGGLKKKQGLRVCET